MSYGDFFALYASSKEIWIFIRFPFVQLLINRCERMLILKLNIS